MYAPSSIWRCSCGRLLLVGRDMSRHPKSERGDRNRLQADREQSEYFEEENISSVKTEFQDLEDTDCRLNDVSW